MTGTPEPLNVVIPAEVTPLIDTPDESITNPGVQNKNEIEFALRNNNISGEEKPDLSGKELIEELRKQREETLEDS